MVQTLAAPHIDVCFFKVSVGVMVMIIAPPGPTQAGWNILHITSTCNLLRFPLTECKGQMGQFETTEICLESCIRPEDNFTGRELSYHHQC